MKELVEFRLVEEFASRLFADTEGQRLGGWIRKVLVRTDDPRFKQIGAVHAELVRDQNRSFFHGWEFRRRYSKTELEKAQLLRLQITATFEPAGEECGTVYDESVACPICGAGRRQVGDLVLDLRKVPKRADFARTIADEWIISQRLAELLEGAGFSGLKFGAVRHKGYHEDDSIDLREYPSGRELIRQAEAAGVAYPSGAFDVWLNQRDREDVLNRAWQEHARAKEALQRRRRQPLPVWYQLLVTSSPVRIAESTRFGINPFDDDAAGEYRCPRSHVRGLNLLSEVFVERDTWNGSDIVVTDGLVGMKRGLLRPHPLLLTSQKVRRLLAQNSVRGYKVEVAHLL